MKRAGLFAVCLLIAGGVGTAPGSSEPAQRGQGPTNLQILPEGVDIRTVMQGIAGSLGVECTHCHIQGDFASDENPKKNVARNMMRMVRVINAGFLDGQANCNLCHRGSALPNTASQ